MKSAVSRAVVAVSVMAALGGVAACSGSGDGGGGGGGDEKSSSSRHKPDAERVSPAERRLAKSALANGDVKGYKVEAAEEAEEADEGPKPERGGGPKGTAPASCRPLADMIRHTAPPRAKARVGRQVTGPDKLNGPAIAVELFAYEASGAGKAMDELRSAAESKKCARFSSDGRRYMGVEPRKAPDKGDEAVSYQVGSRVGDTLLRRTVTVVRSGSTLLAFVASDVFDPELAQLEQESPDGSAGGGKGDDPETPAAVLDAQLAKVRAAK